MFSKAESSTTESDVLHFVRSAGYEFPTSFQRIVTPLILEGRDLVVEAPSGQGKTAAILYPVFRSFRHERVPPRCLIITGSGNTVRKIFRHFHRFSPPSHDKPHIAALGFEDGPKNEIRSLAKFPDVIVGTVERVIDHLRRGNLDVSGTRYLVIDVSEAQPDQGMIHDIQYITSKIRERCRKVVLIECGAADTPLSSELRRPMILKRSDWEHGEIGHEVYFVSSPEEKTALLRRLILEPRPGLAAVLCGSTGDAREIHSALLARGIDSVLSPHDAPRKVERSSRPAGTRCLVASRLEIPTGVRPDTVVYLVPPKPNIYRKTLERLESSGSAAAMIVLAEYDEQDDVFLIEETCNVSIEKREAPIDRESIAARISEIVEEIRNSEDPDELTAYRKILRKNTPFHLRRYVAAYLLKHSSPRVGKKTGKPSGTFKTIFVSVGRNRRVYPKDLVRLFSENLSIEPSAIGTVKVLDNYSFIDIPAIHADKAVDSLNGTEFHGRTVTVNFARKKE